MAVAPRARAWANKSSLARALDFRALVSPSFQATLSRSADGRHATCMAKYTYTETTIDVELFVERSLSSAFVEYAPRPRSWTCQRQQPSSSSSTTSRCSRRQQTVVSYGSDHANVGRLRGEFESAQRDSALLERRRRRVRRQRMAAIGHIIREETSTTHLLRTSSSAWRRRSHLADRRKGDGIGVTAPIVRFGLSNCSFDMRRDYRGRLCKISVPSSSPVHGFPANTLGPQANGCRLQRIDGRHRQYAMHMSC